MLMEEGLDGDAAAMIDDKEIWACAHQLMKRYGDAAWLHAAQRADELLEADEPEGHKSWMRILQRIKELENLTPQGAVH